MCRVLHTAERFEFSSFDQARSRPEAQQETLISGLVEPPPKRQASTRTRVHTHTCTQRLTRGRWDRCRRSCSAARQRTASGRRSRASSRCRTTRPSPPPASSCPSPPRSSLRGKPNCFGSEKLQPSPAAENIVFNKKSKDPASGFFVAF